jgi:hypothetical protein
MNVIRLTPDLKFESSDPEAEPAPVVSLDEVRAKKGLYVFSPETAESMGRTLLAHGRQKEFHQQEMLSKGMPRPQALMHRDQYALHSHAYEALTNTMFAVAGAEVVPVVTDSAERPLEQMVA